jgi:hypothetical protein
MTIESQKPIKKVVDITQIGANIAQVVLVVVPVITSLGSVVATLALASQSTPVQFPGINVALGTTYQMVLWLSACLAYVQFLRSFWKKKLKQGDLKEGLFSLFIINDLLKLHYPLLLIPLLALLGVFLEIATVGVWVLLFIGAFLAMGVLITPHSFQTGDTVTEKWFQRIEQQLREKGIISTETFEECGYSMSRHEEINWALNKYFEKFEISQSLILTPKQPDRTKQYYTQTMGNKKLFQGNTLKNQTSN